MPFFEGQKLNLTKHSTLSFVTDNCTVSDPHSAFPTNQCCAERASHPAHGYGAAVAELH